MPRMKICSCGKMIPDTQVCSCRKLARKVNNQNKDPETKKFFNSSKWKKFRKKIIDRDAGLVTELFGSIYQGICLRCLYKYGLIVTDGIQVHHIKPRNKYNGENGYPDLRFDETNCISLCKSCNTQLGTKGKLDFELESPTENTYEPVL